MFLNQVSDGDLAEFMDRAGGELNRRHIQARQKEQAYAAAVAAQAVDLSAAHFERGAGWTATRTTPPHTTQPNFTAAELMDIIGGGLKEGPEQDKQRIPAADPGASINVVLKERGREYGEFANVARTASEIRAAVMRPAYSFGTQDKLPTVQREAIMQIATKLARIANGNPANVDSWRDIAGYATLVVRDLEA